MFGKRWEMIKRGMAAALSVSLLAGAMSVSSSLPAAAASTKRVEVSSKGDVTINLDGREVWQAAAKAMQEANPASGDIAERIMAQTGSNGNPVVLEDDIYKMELPAKATKGLPTGLGMEMYISAGADDVAEDFAAPDEDEAVALGVPAASASDMESAATGVAEKPVRDFFASSMFSLIKENDESAPAGGAQAAGGEGYELNGSEHIYFVLSNATDKDVNYTVKLGDLEILKTKVLKSHGDTTGVVGASVSNLIGVPASSSTMIRATDSDIEEDTETAELTDDVVAKVVRTTLKNFFVIYRSEETALGTKAMVVTTADMKFKSKDGGTFTTRGDKMVLAVRDIAKDSEEYRQAAATLQNNNVDHADFAAVDISFHKGGDDKDYEPSQGQIVNVRIETRALESFDPDSMSIQHHLDDGSLETVAGTTKKTVVEISDDAEDAVNSVSAVTEDGQTEISVEAQDDGNVYTFDEDANKAKMEQQLEKAGKESSFRMKVESGETALTNDIEKGAPKKKAAAAQTEVKKNSVTKTISTSVSNEGVKTEVQEEKGEGDIKVEDGKVVADFVVDSFSIYTIVDGDTGNKARMTLEFYNGDSKIATMYVKNDDTLDELQTILYDPGVGTLPNGQLFKGWFIEEPEGATYDTNTVPKTIEDIRTWAAGQSITEGDVIKIHAMIFKFFNVTYFGDDTDVSLGSHTVYLRTDENSADYTISMAYTADDHQDFKGWKTTAANGGNNIQGWTEGKVYANDTEITISGDVRFDVEAPHGNWLVYHANGKGGTYNAPQFYLETETTVPAVNASPDNMKRNGYSFGGWYTDEACTDGKEFSFGGTLSDNTDIFAKWTSNTTAPYTVIIWGQNIDKTAYEVLGSYVGDGTVGQNIPYTVVDNGDEDYVTGIGGDNGHYTGFSVVDADKSQQIKITPEGDAVLNLHFDRITYNFKFYLYRDGNNGYDYPNNSGNGRTLNDLVTWHSNQNQHPSVTGYTIQSETVGGRRYYYFTLQAYYGEDISSKWPTYDKITGANGREAVSYVMMVGTKLKPNPTNQGSGTVKGIITVMNENILGATNDSNGNYVMIRFPDNYNNWRYHIWFETVDGEDYTGKTTHTYNGKTYYEDTVLVVRSSNTEDNNQNEPKYTGFDYVTRLGQNNQGVWGGGHWTTREGGTTLYHLNYIYNRLAYSIEYFDGNYVDGNNNQIQNRATHPLHKSNDINQGALIPDADKNYKPSLPDGEEGYVFEGWYLDEGCTTPYVWTTMPVGGIKVYAKWRQIQYRVFLHPNADNADGSSDQSLSWGDESSPDDEKQQMNFRVSYGAKVSTPTGTRTGYEFIGWYRDAACTQVFSADAFELNEETVKAPYNKDTDFTDPMDKWGKGASYNNDLDRPWITKKLDLYGKWRLILEGADGIQVIYDATDEGTGAPRDPLLYLDQANAIAQGASTPTDAENFQFLYWIVQKWDGTKYVDTAEEVYPGDGFTVKAENAKVVTDPQDETKKIYTVQLRAEYGPKEAATPTHITWYANNGTGVTFVDGDLQINQGIDINDASEFSYPKHRFIGWARLAEVSDDDGNVVTIGGKSPGNLKIDLGEEDLWLKYDNGKFYATENTGDGVAAGTEIKQVAADERLVYHGLVAVWEPIPYTLTITKSWDSAYGTEDSVTVSVTLGDGAAAVYTLNKRNNWTEEIKDVYAGTAVTVVETALDNFTTTYTWTPDPDEGEEETGLVEITGKELTSDTTVTIINKTKITPTGLDLDTTAAKTALLSLFAFAMMCVLGFSLKRRYASRR